MTEQEQAPKTPSASLTYLNWQRFAPDKVPPMISEARLYTDVKIFGEVKLGPYHFINPVAQTKQRSRDLLVPGIVLRMEDHLGRDSTPFPMESDSEHYHGGDMFDECAALASLFLGIRLKAGPVDRQFIDGSDPRGRPTHFSDKEIPQLALAEWPQIPSLYEPGNLSLLKTIAPLPDRSPEHATALVKGARLYQQAVWIADHDPELAWLLLVSSVETIAIAWRSGEDDPTERLRAGHAKIVGILETELEKESKATVIKWAAKYAGSTKKFQDFLVTFCPEAPPLRPQPFLQFKFEKKEVRRAAGVIYGHRSNYLHSGIAIPYPMCRPPTRNDAYGPGIQEKPMGTASGSMAGTWTIEETPMLLHLFAYIARGAITNWWESGSVADRS